MQQSPIITPPIYRSIHSRLRIVQNDHFQESAQPRLWPGAQIAERLVIVGEAPLDDKAKAYVTRLREAFGLLIEYQQFDMGTGRVVDR